MNRRIKGSEKFWSEPGAEAILQLRADSLSETETMSRFWLEREAQARQRSAEHDKRKLDARPPRQERVELFERQGRVDVEATKPVIVQAARHRNRAGGFGEFSDQAVEFGSAVRHGFAVR